MSDDDPELTAIRERDRITNLDAAWADVHAKQKARDRRELLSRLDAALRERDELREALARSLLGRTPGDGGET